MIDRLATLYDCFSESDTEKSFQPNGHIAYVESLLRLHNPKHLSQTQAEMRELLLDLLLVYANGRSIGRVTNQNEHDSACTAEGAFCPAGFLLTHTAGKELAGKVCKIQDLFQLDRETRDQLLAWMEGSGISPAEWQMIQPRFSDLINGKQAPATQPETIHPMFSGLQKSSQHWIRDYITRTFIGTRSLIQMGVDLTQLPSRSLSVATVLLEDLEAHAEGPAHISHFPKLTFSRSF